jgi:hypothetical protein
LKTDFHGFLIFLWFFGKKTFFLVLLSSFPALPFHRVSLLFCLQPLLGVLFGQKGLIASIIPAPCFKITQR